ncbi:MAG: DMT family transporter [Chloroflexi bacterium]|nr:DMT family transporter [Chloroflexota bacterium]
MAPLDTTLSALFALSAALTWGSGDFTNGLVTRRIGPLRTVLLSYAVGLVALVIVALALRETLPRPIDLLWGALAGLAGMAGLGFLFRGFASGRMGIIAPVSAVTTAAIPVGFAALTEGLPSNVKLVGFGLALISIWLLSRPDSLGGRPPGLGMGLLAGLGFGGFFTLIDQVGVNAVFWPLVAARVSACTVMLVFALLTRRSVVPPRSSVGLLVLGGMLDVSGNLFFLLAAQTGRLDVASILASFYPAVTATWAWLIVRERLVRLQVAGVVGALIAIMLITI